MEPIYRKYITLTDLHIDCHLRLKPSALLYLVQEMAAEHALALGTGWDALAQKQLFWALIRHKIQITRLPIAGETVTLETWPMPTTRVAYPRATVAYDAQGNELFRSVALWVLMDLQSRAMILPGKSGVIVEGWNRGNELDIPPSITPKELAQVTQRRVGYTDLDRNGHMNNTRYLEWLDDLLSAEFHQHHPLRQITLCYLAEAREGQTLEIHWGFDEAGSLWADTLRRIEDASAKTQRIFAAHLEY